MARWREPSNVRVCMECVDYDMVGSTCRCGQSMMCHVELDALTTDCKLFISRSVVTTKRRKRKKIESVYDYE